MKWVNKMILILRIGKSFYCHTIVPLFMRENEQQLDNRSVLDGQLTDVQRSNVTLHFEDVKREDLWRTIQ
jgi:hypothetical protein